MKPRFFAFLLWVAPAVLATAADLSWTFPDGQPGPWKLDEATVASGAGAGLHLSFSGNDPKMVLEFDQPLDIKADTVFEVQMASNTDGAMQLFWGGNFSETDSVRLPIAASPVATRYLLMFPRDISVRRLRFDPNARPGTVRIESIRLRPGVTIPYNVEVPAGPLVTAPARRTELKAGPLKLALDLTHWQTFDVYVADAGGKEKLAATSIPTERVVLAGGTTLDFAKGSPPTWDGDRHQLRTILRDASGTQWTFEQTFTPRGKQRWIEIETAVQTDRDCEVLRLPMLGLLAGNGSFGRGKNQGLFAGLEYLDDEPSSSEADVTTPEHQRYVPAPHKITFPLMAIQADGVYVGLQWDNVAGVAALFDSPCRKFTGAGHAMAISLPAVGQGLLENKLLAYQPMRLKAGVRLVVKAAILGGPGTDITAAVRHYVAANPLPAPPQWPRNRDAQLSLFADAYTVSKAAEGGLWRHAVWQGFKAGKAADACAFLEWLAWQSNDAALRERAGKSVRAGLERLASSEYLVANVSHIVPPTAPLIFGHLDESLQTLRAHALAQVKGMQPDGTFVFEGELNKTHFEKQAIGYASNYVLQILRAASLLGDADLLAAGLKGLSALVRFDGKVPRGAQTWEIPLHTPDVMGSGRALEALLLGYELTGRKEYLDRAIYWAWTGIPFVYLRDPVAGQPVGRYATIAVYGATHWKAPFWIGLPVQWCGLTYAWPLAKLAQYDPAGPWRTLAEGITVSGMQQLWCPDDSERIGLLPDSFILQQQRRDGPAINPGAVLMPYVELFEREPLHSFRREPHADVWINAPAGLKDVSGNEEKLKFSTCGVAWKEPYRTLLARVPSVKRVKVEDVEVQPSDTIDTAPAPAWHYDSASQRLILKLNGEAKVRVDYR